MISVEFSSKKDLTVKSQFPAVRQSILYGGKKVWVLPPAGKRLNYSADSYWFVVWYTDGQNYGVSRLKCSEIAGFRIFWYLTKFQLI